MIASKKDLEKRAMERLETIFGYDISEMFQVECPDLQDEKNSFGVEVTRDCYENEIERQRFIEGIFGKNVDSIEEKKIKRFERTGAEIKSKNGIINGATLGAGHEENPAHLIGTIENKLKKLNDGHYKDLSCIGLYVFVDTMHLYSSFVQSVIEEISKKEYPKKYDFLFLDGSYECVKCNMDEKTFEFIGGSFEFEHR